MSQGAYYKCGCKREEGEWIFCSEHESRIWTMLEEDERRGEVK